MSNQELANDSVLPNEESLAESSGLTIAVARARLADVGPNELPSRDRRTGLQLAGSVLREPMLLLLLVATALYVVVGFVSLIAADLALVVASRGRLRPENRREELARKVRVVIVPGTPRFGTAGSAPASRTRARYS
jgi:magnesium-transporting ATPase (P-type)